MKQSMMKFLILIQVKAALGIIALNDQVIYHHNQ